MNFRPHRLPLALSGLLSLVGCAPHQHQAAEEPPEAPRPQAPVAEAGPPPDADAVPRALGAFTGYRRVDGQSFPQETFLTLLAAADAVCVGEEHGSVLHHAAELGVLDGLVERRRIRGFELGLGLEMIRTTFQPTLERFGREKGTLAELAPKVEWEAEWGLPLPYYAHQVDRAAAEGVTFLGLGVARALTRSIAQHGIKGLHPDLAERIPELDRAQAPHRALFETLMSGHGAGTGAEVDLDKYYEAQLVWDESMAERSSQFLAERVPARKLLIFAGVAHCHDSAIPSRIRRRGPYEVLSVLPVQERAMMSEGASEREGLLLNGYDFQLVMKPGSEPTSAEARNIE